MKDMIRSETSDFIDQIKSGAVAAYRKYEVLPSLTLAQAILESNWGKSAPGFNLFGIKWSEGCGRDKQLLSTWEEVNGKVIKIKAWFRKYDSYAESIDDHGHLLRYATWKKGQFIYAPVIAAKDYKEGSQQLLACGYATDHTYATQLINLIEQYNLNKWDREGYKMYNDFDEIADWAKPFVEEANKLGLMEGDSSTGNFNPKEPLTREQAAKLIVELYHKING